MKLPQFNSHIATLDAPPIPRIVQAAESYTGDKGPVIDLSQAVPGHPPPDVLLEALAAASSNIANLGYGDIEGEPALRQAYAEDLAYTHGSAVASEQVMITAGCNQAFVAAVLTVASPEQSILMVTPWYFNHSSTLAMFGINWGSSDRYCFTKQPNRDYLPVQAHWRDIKFVCVAGYLVHRR